MKRKAQEIQELLGFSQDEMAQLLRVHRNTVSRFELGKGAMPQHSNLLLGAMLRYIQSPEAATHRPAALEEQQASQATKIQKLLKENEYQYERLSRRLDKAQTKYAQTEKALKLLCFLEERASELPEIAPDVLRLLRRRVDTALQKQGSAELVELELQLDLLVYQKMLLDLKLGKISAKCNENKAS